MLGSTTAPDGVVTYGDAGLVGAGGVVVVGAAGVLIWGTAGLDWLTAGVMVGGGAYFGPLTVDIFGVCDVDMKGLTGFAGANEKGVTAGLAMGVIGATGARLMGAPPLPAPTEERLGTAGAVGDGNAPADGTLKTLPRAENACVSEGSWGMILFIS